MPRSLCTAASLFLTALVALLALVGPAGAANEAATGQCASGKALYETGRFGAAEGSYTKALEKPETQACGQAGLAQLDKLESECKAAAALKSGGRTAEARKAYEAALQKRPESKCAAAGLKDLEEKPLDDPAGIAEDALAWLGLAALAIGGLAVLVAFLVWLMTHTPKLKDRGPAKRVRAVRVSIEAFENGPHEGLGGPVAALARSKIESFGAKSAKLSMIDSQAAAEETIWTKFGAINDQAKAFSAVVEAIGALYPRRRYQVSGSLQGDGGSGPGLSVSLRKQKKIEGATTLWAARFGLEPKADDAPATERLQKLAVPAAAWISHVTTTAAGETPGGAKDPISWALYKTGREWERDSNAEKAKGLYKEAIVIDTSNWGALARLGAIENEAGDYPAAIKHLKQALAVLEEE
ncbi:MAG TPA: hypothetical protein VI039_04235 [Solirubrobacterales bacterium]